MAISVLGLIGVGGLDAPAEAASSRMPLRSQYVKSLGRTFTARHGGRRYQVRLSHIDDVAGATHAMREHSFNLIFTAPDGMPDGVYAIARPGLRTHSLFLSRIGTVKRGRATMQALINRTVS